MHNRRYQSQIAVPAGTQNGKVFRLAGKGMPKQGAGGPGSSGTLYATVLAELPEQLSDEEIDLFERLKELRNGAGPRAESPDESPDETTDDSVESQAGPPEGDSQTNERS